MPYDMSATYSPEDNKLRLYSVARLDKETYDRVKAAGFSWAPQQKLFVAPMWTPEREDLLIELCGEIDDEDTTLVARAATRAERFEDYKDARAEDAERARAQVERITDGIPLGQPILVGHHSERHARKDAERIENGMRKAVKMWETSQYWKQRAAGALAAAKYKERPDVRARRIKGLEADIRRCRAAYTPLDATRTTNYEGRTLVFCGPKGGRGGSWVDVDRLPAIKARYSRWIQHYENRLEYERAMLGEDPAERFNVEVGGRVLVRDEWLIVLKVNRSAGAVSSVTTNARYVSVVSIENVKDYRPPDPEEAAKVKAAVKLPPLCNYPGEGFEQMTKAEYDAKAKRLWSDFPKVGLVAASDEAGAHRVRQTRKTGEQYYNTVKVYLTDQKRTDPPAPAAPKPLPPRQFEPSAEAPRVVPPYREPNEYEQIKEALKTGAAVQVVSAPQLFPTPPELARHMVELAGVNAGQRVLEPSAGTGAILRQIQNAFTGADCGNVVAIEISTRLAAELRRVRDLTLYANESNYKVIEADFLQQNGNLGKFDAIVMNPPFANAQDIAHIKHALTFLKPNGRLVAICAGGPRQAEQLKPLVDAAGGSWEPLPPDTFKESGTGVNTVLLSITAPPAEPWQPSQPSLYRANTKHL